MLAAAIDAVNVLIVVRTVRVNFPQLVASIEAILEDIS